jgi:hypothetical protein
VLFSRRSRAEEQAVKKTLAFVLIVVGFAAHVQLAAGKKIEPPPEDRAVVYLGRMTGFVGRARPFHFFADGQYLGRVKGKNYIRYECDPGEHLFWVAAETRSFVKADLEAEKSYALFARLQAGTWSARAELQPITQGSKAWGEFSKMIRGTKPQKVDQTYIQKWETNHPDYIERALAEWKAAGEPALVLKGDESID